jgi:hypothetical protein
VTDVSRIRIVTSGPDYGVNLEQYEELTGDLESRGVKVSIETAPEFRSGLEVAIGIAVYVKDIAQAGVTLAQLAELLKKHLRGKRVGATRIVKIYGADGGVLARVELKDDGPDSS